jgi:hypothetical protein
MARQRRVWEGIESIREGDKIKWELPITGKTNQATVYGIISTEVLSPEHGICLHFFADIMKFTNNSVPAFERVIPEAWITHWKGQKLPRPSSASTNRTVRSYESRKLESGQFGLPIGEGA